MPLLSLGAGLLVGCALGLSRMGDLRNGNVPELLLLYFAAALAYLVSLAGLRRLLQRGPLPLGPLLAFVAVVALACRLPLLAQEPSLSTDFYRYAWEGRVQWEGLNPYATAPADPALAPLRDGLYLQVNHPEIPTIYPPVLELTFALAAGLEGALGAVLPLKLVLLLAELGLCVLLARFFARRGWSPAWILVYAWHPLPLLEVSSQGHLEPIPIALALLAVDLAERGRGRGAALALGLATFAKYLPGAALPALLWRAPWRQVCERLVLFALPALLFLPYLGAGRGLGQGLGEYAVRWRHNDGGFFVLDQGLRGLGISQWLAREVFGRIQPLGYDAALNENYLALPAKAAVGAILLTCLSVWLFRSRASQPGHGEAPPRPPLATLLAGTAALFLIFSPTVHPWYALWLLPFVAVLPGRAGWLLLTLVLPLSYAAQLRYVAGLGETWGLPVLFPALFDPAVRPAYGWEIPGVRLLEYLPALLVVAAGWRWGPASEIGPPARESRKV